MNQPDLNKLKSTLLTSGLQQSNNPLYQVINSLIDAVRQFQGITINDINAINQTINNITNKSINNNFGMGSIDGIDGLDGIGINGKDGVNGKDGIPGIDGLDGEDAPIIVGPSGRDGKDGLTIPGMDGESIDLGFMQPPGTPSSGSTSPGGSDTQVQFNDSGVFGGDAGLTYNKTTNALTLSGNLVVDTDVLFVNTSDGNVGIGTTDPNNVGWNRALTIEQIGTNHNSGLELVGQASGANDIVGAISFLSFNGISTRDESARIAMWRGTNYDDGNLAFYAAPTATPIGDSTVRMFIKSDGNIGIGTTNPQAQLHTTSTVRFANFGAGAATFDASGNISSVSDITAKENIENYEIGLPAILKIKPIRYNWKKETGLDTLRSYVGFSAQDVLPWIPDAVDIHRRTGQYSLNPFVILAAVVNSIQEISTRLNKLDKIITPEPTPITVSSFSQAIKLDKMGVAIQLAEEDKLAEKIRSDNKAGLIIRRVNE